MINCKMSIYLAYSMLIYVFASLFYLVLTRNLGTPFKDSLTKEQNIIKNKSASKRRRIFYMGLAVGLILIVVIQPFQKC